MSNAPTAYAELAAIISDLPMLAREKRRREGMSIRAAARALGCSFSTLYRIEAGEDYNSRIPAQPAAVGGVVTPRDWPATAADLVVEHPASLAAAVVEAITWSA
jgi:transcriptional regulator with XRE-family HTH domain